MSYLFILFELDDLSGSQLDGQTQMEKTAFQNGEKIFSSKQKKKETNLGFILHLRQAGLGSEKNGVELCTFDWGFFFLTSKFYRKSAVTFVKLPWAVMERCPS